MITRIRIMMVVLIVLLSAFCVLSFQTLISHSLELNEILGDYACADRYNNISVTDRNGEEIYASSFNDSKSIRMATFHLIGDRYGSVPSAVLSQESQKPLNISKISGYTPQETSIQLTVDLRLQCAAYSLLSEQGNRGSVVVLDYTTGEVVVMVSTPSVDVTHPDECEDGAFLCKATSAYTPGSTMKAISAAAILEKDSLTAESFQYYCTGTDGYVCCYGNAVHAEQSLAEILPHSCNCGMATATKAILSPDDLQRFAHGAHVFNSDIFLDYKCAAGNMNAEDDLAWSACGQSQDLLTPIGVASFYGALADDGRLFYPHIYSDTKWRSESIMKDSTADYIAAALEQVAVNAGIQCKAFGKTGTAELGGGVPSHSWFVCSLTDVDAPTYTVLVFLENGGESSQAKEILSTYVNTYILGGDTE